MTSTKKAKFIPIMVAVSMLFIVGVTLAWVGFSFEKRTTVRILGVELDITTDAVETLENVTLGDTIVDSVTFTPAEKTSRCYVRAKISYDTENAPSSDDKRYIIAINHEDITTTETSEYKWVRQSDGYYYLVDTNGVPLVVDSSDSDYTFCENVVFTGESELYGTIPVPNDLILETKVQAIQAQNLPSTALADLPTYFASLYGQDPKYGYIVTFDTGEGSTIIAQTFLANGMTASRPYDPVLMGYELEGWYTDPEYQNVYDFSSLITQDMTLYAKYTFYSLFKQYESGSFEGHYYIELGMYPQSLYTGDESLLTLVDGKTYDIDGSTCNVYTDGAYEFVQFTSTSSNNSYYNQNTHASYQGTHFYRVEPVKWIILGYEEGHTSGLDFANFSVVNGAPYVDANKTILYTGTNGQPPLLVISEKILVQSLWYEYDGDITFAVKYGSSLLYSNTKKLENVMFNESELAQITYVNLQTSYYRSNAGETLTNQKLFSLATYWANVGHRDNYNDDNWAKGTIGLGTIATDLGHATGAYQNWWLRSAAESSYGNAHYVYYGADREYGGMKNARMGIRPCFLFVPSYE